jgi:hypothetical protein
MTTAMETMLLERGLSARWSGNNGYYRCGDESEGSARFMAVAMVMLLLDSRCLFVKIIEDSATSKSGHRFFFYYYNKMHKSVHNSSK